MISSKQSIQLTKYKLFLVKPLSSSISFPKILNHYVFSFWNNELSFWCWSCQQQAKIISTLHYSFTQNTPPNITYENTDKKIYKSLKPVHLGPHMGTQCVVWVTSQFNAIPFPFEIRISTFTFTWVLDWPGSLEKAKICIPM